MGSSPIPATKIIRQKCRMILGPLVKRLRHRPFTAVTWVRFPYGSPKRKRRSIERLFLFGVLIRRNKAAANGGSSATFDFEQSGNSNLRTWQAKRDNVLFPYGSPKQNTIRFSAKLAVKLNSLPQWGKGDRVSGG